MTGRKETPIVEIGAKGGFLARFLMRALEISDKINEILALLDKLNEEVARTACGLHGRGSSHLV
jgi:hypothetical protein